MDTSFFLQPGTFDKDEIRVSSRNYNNKERISIMYGHNHRGIAFVTPPAVTNYPRLTGDGNFRAGSAFGPTSIDKASFQVDLSNNSIKAGEANCDFDLFLDVVEAIDEALLTFVTNNQWKILGRKNLTREEVRMLQIRSVRQRKDPHTGNLGALCVNLNSKIFYWDQVGNKRRRTIPICDHAGKIEQTLEVLPGDIVSCTMQLNDVYTGVGGDKFGISWQVNEVCVVAPYEHTRSDVVPAFTEQNFPTLDYSGKRESESVGA